MLPARELYTKIVETYEEGITDRDTIAVRVSTSPRTVSRYLSKWRSSVPVENVGGPGQPPTFTAQERSQLGRLVADKPLASSKELASVMQESSGKVFTSRTIRNTLHRMGYKNSLPRTVPLLTSTMEAKRVIWARANATRDWPNVLFTDETSIQLSANITRAWHKSGQRPTVPRTKFPIKLMFWAGVSRDRRTELVLVEGTITGAKYVDLLRTHFLPWMRRQKKGTLVFQQDNAPAHTSRVAKAFFEAEGIDVMEWPASSPDLNPIENLWGILKMNVDKRKPTTKDELLTAAKEEWTKIPFKTIRACIDSMNNRLKLVIDGEGKHINY
jgi:transposase